jgi:hypothetical protein
MPFDINIIIAVQMVPRSGQFAVWYDIEASRHVFGTAGTGYEGKGPRTHDRERGSETGTK